MITKHKIGECQICYENVGVQNLRKSEFSEGYVCQKCFLEESEAEFEYQLEQSVRRLQI